MILIVQDWNFSESKWQLFPNVFFPLLQTTRPSNIAIWTHARLFGFTSSEHRLRAIKRKSHLSFYSIKVFFLLQQQQQQRGWKIPSREGEREKKVIMKTPNNQRHVSTNNTWKLLGSCCVWEREHQPKTVCRIKSTFPASLFFHVHKNPYKKFKNHFSFFTISASERVKEQNK